MFGILLPAMCWCSLGLGGVDDSWTWDWAQCACPVPLSSSADQIPSSSLQRPHAHELHDGEGLWCYCTSRWTSTSSSGSSSYDKEHSSIPHGWGSELLSHIRWVLIGGLAAWVSSTCAPLIAPCRHFVERLSRRCFRILRVSQPASSIELLEAAHPDISFYSSGSEGAGVWTNSSEWADNLIQTYAGQEATRPWTLMASRFRRQAMLTPSGDLQEELVASPQHIRSASGEFIPVFPEGDLDPASDLD